MLCVGPLAWNDSRYEHNIPHKGDIMTVYHPDSGLPATVDHQKDYKPRAELGPGLTPPVLPQESQNESEVPPRRPWHPFNELLDFEFAEVALEARLSRGQIDRLLKIIEKAVAKMPFTLRTSSQLEEMWASAPVLQTQVSFLEPLFFSICIDSCLCCAVRKIYNFC